MAWVCGLIATFAFAYAVLTDRPLWVLLSVAVLVYGMLPLLRPRRPARARLAGRPGGRHVLLGDLLVHTYGWVTPGQLRRALVEQKGTRKLLGAVLLEMGVLTAMQLETALEHQRQLEKGRTTNSTVGEEQTAAERTKALLQAR